MSTFPILSNLAPLPHERFAAHRELEAQLKATMRGEVHTGTTHYTFKVWSPTPKRQPDHHRFCTALLDLALDRLPGEPSQRALHDIRRYLAE